MHKTFSTLSPGRAWLMFGLAILLGLTTAPLLAQVSQVSEGQVEDSSAPAMAMPLAAPQNISFTVAPDAMTKGQFGPLHDWPLVPIAMMGLPDGRVLAYGSDGNGKQGADEILAVWDPSKGTRDNPTGLAMSAVTVVNIPGASDPTNLFCAGQMLLPSGQALIFGGDSIVANKSNNGNKHVHIFNPSTNQLTQKPAAEQMKSARWYPTAVMLPTGEQLVLGGHVDVADTTFANIPDVRSADGSRIRPLTAASSDDAYGANNWSWFYPRAWVDPLGDVFILGPQGKLFNLKTAGTGTLKQYITKTRLAAGGSNIPAIMYAPGKIISLRKDGLTALGYPKPAAITVDLNKLKTGQDPEIAEVAAPANYRHYGNMTVLADGTVWVNGGSIEVVNKDAARDKVALQNAHYVSELWNPDLKTWSAMAEADLGWAAAVRARAARLYHSTALLLPDGSVLTGGGGARGPVTNLNGEIYYPPYLFRNNSGTIEFAPRPTIQSVSSTSLKAGESLNISIGSGHISRITLVRVGAATHAFNNETRFLELGKWPGAFGPAQLVTLPGSKEVPPGYYMLFAWNKNNVPSIAKIIQITDSASPAS